MAFSFIWRHTYEYKTDTIDLARTKQQRCYGHFCDGLWLEFYSFYYYILRYAQWFYFPLLMS